MFAYDYDKKEKRLDIFGAEINKSNGENVPGQGPGAAGQGNGLLMYVKTSLCKRKRKKEKKNKRRFLNDSRFVKAFFKLTFFECRGFCFECI
jgi:hypothetical protein